MKPLKHPHTPPPPFNKTIEVGVMAYPQFSEMQGTLYILYINGLGESLKIKGMQYLNVDNVFHIQFFFHSKQFIVIAK
jgi:hypothetical protein